MILKIPEDVYDAPSFIAGVELILDKIRKSDTIICNQLDPRFDPHNPQKDSIKLNG